MPNYSDQSVTANSEQSIDQPQLSWEKPGDALQLSVNQVDVWAFALDLPEAELQKLNQFLSPDERTRASKFYFPKDQKRFIAGRGILRSLLGRYLEVDPSSLHFTYTERGKPLLVQQKDLQLHFNLAHSHNLALFAVGHHPELGVDVEADRPIEDLQQIARRFFSRQETDCLLALPTSQQRVAFFRCWTRKEAVLKATGSGITDGLDQFDVTLVPTEPARILDIRIPGYTAAEWSLFHLEPAPGFLGALAVRKRDICVRHWRRAPID